MIDFVYDNVHGIIVLSPLERTIMEHPVFARLHHVYQNSSAFLVWPTMRNQRFEHSVGTMHVAGEMYVSAVANASDDAIESFFSCFADELRVLVEGPSKVVDACFDGKGHLYRRLAIGALEPGDDWRSEALYVPRSVPERFVAVHDVLYRAVRLVGLLHDVGHPPFSHVCEAALMDLRRDVCRKPENRWTNAERTFVSTIGAFLGDRRPDELPLHEQISKHVVELLMVGVCQGERDAARRARHALVFMTASAIMSDDGAFADLHAIVDGTVDADRLDFVRRDSMSSGFGADAVQYDSIVADIRLFEGEEYSDEEGAYPRFVFAYPLRALNAVEMFLRKRLDNYRSIIYHCDVVKSGVLMKRAIGDLAASYLRKREKKRPPSYAIPRDVSGLWYPCQAFGRGTADESLAFCQWNDAWIISMLTEEYASLAQRADALGEAASGELFNVLDELLFSRRHYHALVRDGHDCRWFRNEFGSLSRQAVADLRAGRISDLPEDLTAAFEGVDLLALCETPVEKELARLLERGNDPSLNLLAEIDGVFDSLPIEFREESRALPALSDVVEVVVRECLAEHGLGSCSVLVDKSGIKTGLGARVVFYGDERRLLSMKEVSYVHGAFAEEVARMASYYAFVDIDPSELEFDLCYEVESSLAWHLVKAIEQSIAFLVCSRPDV